MRYYDNKTIPQLVSSILELSHDGNDLAPDHLELCGRAIEDTLDTCQLNNLVALYEQLAAGLYHSMYKYFYQIPNLSKAEDGRLFYKNEVIAFLRPHEESSIEQEYKYAQYLSVKCQRLEQRGIKPSLLSVQFDIFLPPGKYRLDQQLYIKHPITKEFVKATVIKVLQPTVCGMNMELHYTMEIKTPGELLRTLISESDISKNYQLVRVGNR
jgi:hypothetical protein